MSFKKYHGITLPAGAFIENMNVEQLAADPTPLSAGRIWFNSTAKLLKFSSLDSEGAVIVQSFGSDADLAALEAVVNVINGDSTTAGSFRKEIADIVGTAPEALNTLQEIATALNNDPDLYNTLTTMVNTGLADLNAEILGTATEAMDTLGEVQTAVGLINTTIADLAGLTTDAKGSVVAAINEVDAHADANATAIANEVTRATGVEGALASLTTTAKTSLVAAINEVDAEAGANATAIATNATAIATNATAIADETTRATGVEGSLASLTTDAKTTLVAAINEVDANADTANASAAANATAISNEVTRATGVEGTLANLTTTAKGNLVEAINEVAAAAGDGTDALRDLINAKTAVYTAGAAATVHTFNHGLAGDTLSVELWVQDGTKWVNDDALVEVNAATTTVTVNLVVAAVVKLIVTDKSAIA
jgi:hypothetical protein